MVGEWGGSFSSCCFFKLYKSETHELLDNIFEPIPLMVSDYENEKLTCATSLEEIKEVVFSMAVESAPRVLASFSR